MTEAVEIKAVAVGSLATNCYLVMNRDTRELFLVDPGSSGKALAEEVRRLEAVPKAILLTHGHYDHTGGVRAFLEAYPGTALYACCREKRMLEEPDLNAAVGFPSYTVSPDHYVKEGDVIEAAGMSLRVLETPGHTAGSVCYYSEAEQVLFAGDTLFRGSCGRTDLGTGSDSAMRQSLTRLAGLPDSTDVLPGHGPMTTIAHEKESSPVL